MRTTNFTRRARLTLTVAAVLTTAPVARAASLTPEQQCQKGRHAAAGKHAQCQQKVMATYFAGGDVAALNPALSKCRVKYTGTWDKLHEKALGTGSRCALDRFIGDGNGQSVTDNLTGLQWESKSLNTSPISYVGYTFTWTSGGGQASGSLFNGGFLYVLNGAFNGFCSGGQCDWRLPTRAELQTILSEPFICTTAPCIDGAFNPTTANYYWTSTSDVGDPTLVWVVHFGSGLVASASKTDSWYVRAVRGGL